MKISREKCDKEAGLIEHYTGEQSEFSDYLEQQARAWLRECIVALGELDKEEQLENIANYSRLTVLKIVSSNYDGGLQGFVRLGQCPGFLLGLNMNKG